MSRPNKILPKLESSASAMPMGRRASSPNETKKTKVSSSASNITRTTERGTTKRKAAAEPLTKGERYLGGGSMIYTEDEGTENDEEGTVFQEQETKRIKQQKDKEEEAASKCFEDWKDFYIQIFGNLKSKSDLIIAFTHYMLTKNGFRCLGLGDDRIYSEHDRGDINLPEGWNHFPKYAIRYIYNRMLHILLAVHLEHRLVINLLNTRTNVVTNITVFPEITVRSTCGGPIDKLIPNPEKLAQSLYSNMIQTFTDTKACEHPPFLQSSSSSQNTKSWNELELRQIIGQAMPIKEVVKEVERPSFQGQEVVSQVSQILNSQIQNAVEETTQKRTDSFSSPKSSKRTSWADQQPEAANASKNNSNKDNNNSNKDNNTTKRLSALKTKVDQAVPPVKDAILCYVDAMVNNWVGTYGKEIMKSGKMAIRNLAEQREIIEKYMQLAKPLTEPKGGFVIYNSKITLDDSKQQLLRETIERDLRKYKEETLDMSVYNEVSKPFTEIMNASSQMAETKKESRVDVNIAEPAKVSGLLGRGSIKKQKNLKNMQTKIRDGTNKKKVVLNAELKAQTKPSAAMMKTTKLKHAVLTPPKIELYSQKHKTKLLKNEINTTYKVMGLKCNTMDASNRKKGGSETKPKITHQNPTTKPQKMRNEKLPSQNAYQGSEAKPKATQRNTKTKPTENLKRKPVTSKSPTSAPKKSKSNTSSIKSSKTLKPENLNKKIATAQVKISRSNALKKIRFDLPRKCPPTPSYLSGKWPTTYKSLESLLRTSLPFKAQERKSGGYEQTLEQYKKSINMGRGNPNMKTRTLNISGISKISSDFSLKSIETNFAKQIEAKRLELLEMVRRRSLPSSVQNNNIEDDLSKQFIQRKGEVEKDVGSFVPPADDWSLWQFKLNLANLRQKEALCAPNKKIYFKN